MNFDPDMAAAANERIHRLMGLRLKYLLSIPIGIGIAWLAALAGASQIVSVIVMIGAQLLYGFLLGIHDGVRQVRKRRRAR